MIDNDRRHPTFTNEQLDHLAEILAEKFCEKTAEKTAERSIELMKDQFYQETGKTVFKGILYLLGIIGVSILYWLNKNNYLHLS